jgi:CDP-glucose 4,6-dehydratase
MEMLHGRYGKVIKPSYRKNFWKNKKVFLTGHTGFKGSWLSLILNILGAKVVGYSLKPKNRKNLFTLASLDKILYKSIYGDIRDYKKLKKSISSFAPEIIIHMAAQPLVRQSYLEPQYTYEVNTLGTLNVLKISNQIKSIKAGLIVTTDKVYENNNLKTYYKEDDKLGGIDPYSSSKACAELICSTYINSFLTREKKYFATARAGNVIGGGDFSHDRIVPDYFKSLKKGTIFLRYPNSTRPWQHVMDPLMGYLSLLENLFKNKKIYIGAWNFGPKKNTEKKVIEVIQSLNKNFNNCVKIRINQKSLKNYYESKNLHLDSAKAKKFLKWEPKYNAKKSIELTAEWHKGFVKGCDIFFLTRKQILEYLNL